MASKSRSELFSISKMPEISSTDKSRLPNKAAISRFSKSKLFIRPDKSRSSNSRPVNFNMAVMEDMSKSGLFNISISSEILIVDKS